MPSKGPRKGIFYGWWIVLIGLMVNAVPAGLYFIGFAVLFLPITRELGMSRAAASLPFSLTRAIAAVQSPIIGIVIDRFGPGRVLFVCSLLAGLGFILLSRVESYLTYFLVILLVLSPPIMGGFDSTSITATCRWFIRRRGMALAITVLGFSIGGAAIPPILSVASDAFRMEDNPPGRGSHTLGHLPAPQHSDVQLPRRTGPAARRGPASGRRRSIAIVPSIHSTPWFRRVRRDEFQRSLSHPHLLDPLPLPGHAGHGVHIHFHPRGGHYDLEGH